MLTDRFDLVFGSTKCYRAVVSTAFRQWPADSHCNQNHGYGLSFTATFETLKLDSRNWVVDFGGLKTFKNWLEDMFDHKTLVAKDDPALQWFKEGEERGALTIRNVTATGCEAIALLTFEQLERWLRDNNYYPRVWLAKLEVSEHEGNSAYVRRRWHTNVDP